MKEYLIVECRELYDGYEWDADHKPLCLTTDISAWKFRKGCEIYEVTEDKTFNLIKDYDSVLKDYPSQEIWFVDTLEEPFFSKEKAINFARKELEKIFKDESWDEDAIKEALEEFEKTNRVECIIEVYSL